MKKNYPFWNTDRKLAALHHGALLVADRHGNESLAFRLAEGESWSAQSMHLAMLMSGESFLNKLRPTSTDHDCSPQQRIRQVTIRRNSFTPEFEPSRHEMRVFDSVEGIFTEM